MNRLLKTSFLYTIGGLVGGVLFREVTKLSGFTGQTSLRLLHVHLIGLGTFLFLFLVLFCTRVDLTADKSYKKFFIIYNTGLVGMTALFGVRGYTDIFVPNLSSMADASISGIAGLFHITMTVGLIFLFRILKRGVAAISAQKTA